MNQVFMTYYINMQTPKEFYFANYKILSFKGLCSFLSMNKDPYL